MISRERSMGFRLTNEKEARRSAEELILCGYNVDIYIEIRQDGMGIIRAGKSDEVNYTADTFLLCQLDNIPIKGYIVDVFRSRISDYRDFYGAWLNRRYMHDEE